MKSKDWRARAQAHREQRAIPLELPSGMIVRFCRPNLAAWLAGGRIPETFMVLLERVQRGEISEEAALTQLSADDAIHYARFLNDIIISSVVEPKIVLQAAGEEDIGLDEIPDDDLQFLLIQALQLAPKVPVKTKGGDVPLADVESFRDESKGCVPFVAGGDVPQVLAEAVKGDGHTG